MVSLKVAAAFVALTATTLPLATSGAAFPPGQCRNLPGDPAYPKPQHWEKFNSTIGGRLIAPKPTAWSCYDESADPALCKEVKAKYFDAYFRSDRPGTQQGWYWEEKGTDKCVMETPEGATCKQGNVPVLGVEVKEVADIQKAVDFAAKHKLRLVVKTSGHDFQGRSAAEGSFLIWMRNFRDIAIHDGFVPKGVKADPTPAITVTGGVAWGEVYKYLKDHAPQYSVVGGQSSTVGAAGGYALGGGHGALSPAFGLAVDSILEIKIVTADGKFRTVNEKNDPDLFWALRGGGGGTFGVVTSVTYKLHNTPPAFSCQLLILYPTNGAFAANTQEDIMTVWAQNTPQLDKNKWGGYFTLNSGIFWGTLIAPVNATTGSRDYAPIVKGFKSIPNVYTEAYTIPFQHFADWHTYVSGLSFPATGTDYTGARSVVASRLIPESALTDPRKLAKEMVSVSVKNGLGRGFIGHLVNGLGVRGFDKDSKHTSVHPGWRESVYHALWYHEWNHATSPAEIQQKMDTLSGAVQIVRDAYPGTGVYGNEGFYHEPNWQNEFWGKENYLKLLKIKAKYDKKGLFVCHQCVGSEVWSEDGNCQVFRKNIKHLPIDFADGAIEELSD